MTGGLPERGDDAGAVSGTDDTSPPELRSLHPRAVTLWRITTLGRGLLMAGVIIAAEIVIDIPVPTGMVGVGAAILAVAAAAMIPQLRYDAWGFALRDQDLYMRRGVLFRSTSIVPHARIQHVDTRHGPVDRWLGLAGVVVFTAGNRGAILTIPALDRQEAEEIRDRLAAQSGAGDAV